MRDLQEFSKYLLENGIGKDEGEKILRESKKLDIQEKRLIYSYCYPRHIGDYELPLHIQDYRKKQGNSGKGWLVENNGEACILVEAYRSLQYSRFMRHLMHAFLNPDLLGSCSGLGDTQCPICGKTIYYHESWQNLGYDTNQEELAIMSKESSVCLCKDCLTQLIYAHNLITCFEGDNFLVPSWQKGGTKTS